MLVLRLSRRVSVKRIIGLVAALTIAAASAATLGVGRADAGLLPCAYPAISQPFSAWGDLARYYLSPGGGFENGGWKLGYGASVVDGNESFYANSSADSRSLQLSRGASAQGPYSCIGATDLKVRMFVRSDTSAPVRVDVVVPTLLGLLQTVGTYYVPTSPDWQPSQAIFNLGNALSLLMLSGGNISVKVSAPNATTQVDDVYIDPSWLG
jgi:hypothetical protein